MKKQPPKKLEFWVTNISQEYDVALADLAITIRRGESRNLLDSRHYSYTVEQLQKSAESGSIWRKSKAIKVREVRPVPIISPGVYESKDGRQVTPLRSKVEIIIPQYEELDIATVEAQEKFALEDADIVDDDVRPVLAVDKKYVAKSDE